MRLRDLKTIQERRKFLEKKIGISFFPNENFPDGFEVAQERNCENMIGVVHVPVGVAGPILLNGKSASGEIYIPLATTEGALVASVNRGCKAINQNGGVSVYTENIGITRGPVFRTSGLAQGLHLKQWVKDEFAQLQKIVVSTSSHIALIKVDFQISGRNIYMRFYYDTQDAMGMNMITIATQELVSFIEDRMKVKCTSLAGNYDIDKKPAWLNFISGRGRKVWSEAVLKESTIKEVLKTTPSAIHDVSVSKNLVGSALSGSLGFNAHFANVIAAIFIATGQDAAHVVEGSLGICTTEIVDNNSLYISAFLPDLPVGTIGGGTNLPSQKKMLELMGLAGGDKGSNGEKIAEIIGASVLAGELSLLASLAEGSLAKTHERLGRGKVKKKM